MHKVIIIGGGFAGLSALGQLLRDRKHLDITLIDKSTESSFLPMLPDVIGREVPADRLTYNIEQASKKYGFRSVFEEVASVDPEKREVLTSGRSLRYDYLLISSGSETNFYGSEQIKRFASKLDDARDAERLHRSLAQGNFDCYVVSGGGYTGVEVAANLRVYLNKNSARKRVIIVERAPAILGPLPQWMKDYVADNLRRLDIECITNTAIEKIEERKVSLQGGIEFRNPLVIWTAGVKTADFIQKLNAQKNPQGRIKVDTYLRLNDNCFVAGDASWVAYKKSFLRMAVQFAIAQGEVAAANIIKSIWGRRLTEYQPLDLGYIIPMANNQSCGRVLGIDMAGILPTLLHYCMCIYRSHTLKNKFGIIKALMKGGRR